MSAKDIARELNVDAVLEPTIMCLGDSVCMQFRLVSTIGEEDQIWVGDYREDKRQILNLYNRITKQIADEVRVGLTPDEDRLLAEDRTVNPVAFDAFLRGQYYWERLDPNSIPKALEYFELAIEKEPGWADPYAGLAQTWSQLGRFGLIPGTLALQKKNQYLYKALELDPNSAHAHYVNANNAVWIKWNWAQGEEEYLKTLKLNPNNALARLYYSHLLICLRRTKEAVQQANLGLELDPLKPIILGLYGIVMTDAGDYESAINSLDKALSLNPDYNFAIANLMLPCYLNGDYDRWMESWGQTVNWSEKAKSSVIQEYNKKGHLAAIEKMFELNIEYAPQDCYMSDGIKAIRYIHLGNYEKAIDQLEEFCKKGPVFTSNTDYITPSLFATYIGTNLYDYDKLKDHPRYIGLLKKMRLSLPGSN
jgi:tetratricopeptide (TPR) repeat protein